jgi:hypothetical protein
VPEQSRFACARTAVEENQCRLRLIHAAKTRFSE